MDFWLAASHRLYSVYNMHTWQYRETTQPLRYRMPPRNLRKRIGWWLWHCGVECGYGLIAKTCGLISPRNLFPQNLIKQSRWLEVYIWRIFNVGLHPLVFVQPVNCRFPAFYFLGILLCLGRLLGLVWSQGVLDSFLFFWWIWLPGW